MGIASLEPAALFEPLLEFSAKNLTVEKLFIQLGLDPNNVTYEAIFNRLLDLAIANITFANILALLGGIFLISTFLVRTIVPMRVLCIVSVVFFLGAAIFAGSIQHFLMYFLALPVNIIRLVQIRNLVKKARSSARGDLSLDWLRPFMTPRHYQKGDVLFRKGDDATEMFLTASRARFFIGSTRSSATSSACTSWRRARSPTSARSPSSAAALTSASASACSRGRRYSRR